MLTALTKADAKIDALERHLGAVSAKQSEHTLLLAVVALVAQIIGSNLWRLTYKPRPIPACIERSSYERPHPASSR